MSPASVNSRTHRLDGWMMGLLIALVRNMGGVVELGRVKEKRQLYRALRSEANSEHGDLSVP